MSLHSVSLEGDVVPMSLLVSHSGFMLLQMLCSKNVSHVLTGGMGAGKWFNASTYVPLNGWWFNPPLLL